MYKIDKTECIECGFCSKICPKNAIIKKIIFLNVEPAVIQVMMTVQVL